jgi:nucleotide-binding universal stress UspA family protein
MMPNQFYDNVLCCLDLTSTDQHITDFARWLKNAGIIGNLNFIHVISSELEEKAKEYTDFETWNKYKHGIKIDIENEIKKQFEDVGEINVIVRGGSPLEVISAESKSGSVDLTIVGKKNNSKGSGVASKHVARSSTGDVVFIPEGWDGKSESVLMAYDFSEHAERTIKTAFWVAEKLEIRDINVLNVLPSPTGFFKKGMVHRDFVDAEKNSAQKKWNKECKLHPEYAGADFLVLENEKNDISHYILTAAAGEASPIIFVGSKGKTASSAFLLGSVTEKLLLSEINNPIWIHKVYGENFDLFDAIFKGD